MCGSNVGGYDNNCIASLASTLKHRDSTALSQYIMLLGSGTILRCAGPTGLAMATSAVYMLSSLVQELFTNVRVQCLWLRQQLYR